MSEGWPSLQDPFTDQPEPEPEPEPARKPTGGAGPANAGRWFEYRVKRQLAGSGYHLGRSSGSHGPWDLIAMRRGELVLVQCKLNGSLPPGEWNALLDVATEVGGIAVLAQRESPTRRARVIYRQLLARKGQHREGKLWQPWQPTSELVDW